MDCPFCDTDKILADASFITDFGSTIAMTDWDQRYKGSCILLLKKHYENLVEVPNDELNIIMANLQHLARTIRDVFQPDKMNYLMLGNSVSHLHWYIICRYQNDENWGGPPVFKPGAEKLSDLEYKSLAERIRVNL